MPESPATLAAALVQLQARLPRIGKGQTADTGKYTYRYADYAAIIADVRPLLTELGFAWTCLPSIEDGQFGLRYRLLYASTEGELTGFYPLPQNLPAQARGSEITYGRRYCLTAVLDIALDDDDGKAATDAWQPPAHPHTRKADRHNAARSGPLPDDEFTNAPLSEDPGTVTDSQGRQLSAWFTKAGITGARDRLAYAQMRLNAPGLEASDQLSMRQAEDLIAFLKEEGR